jgi:glycosyltransferase involved in cell wall biosynthesis
VNVWICIAYDPLPGIDHTTRLLRYGTLAEQLASCGHSVTMWTSTFDHWRKTQRFDRDHTAQLNDFLRIELLYAPAYGSNVSWSRVRHNRVLADRFSTRAADMRPPDVIFAGIPCLELTEAAGRYARGHDVPFNVDVQDIWPEVYVSVLPRALRPLGRAILRREFTRGRDILRGATAVTAVSRQYLDWAHALRGGQGSRDRVFHLGYGLPPQSLLESARTRAEEFLDRLQLPRDKPLVTFLGQFAASYDVETVVEAARILESAGPDVHFVLAGAGDKFAQVQQSTRGLRSVTLTGWLEYQDTIALLQQSHIGLAAYARRAPQSLPYKPFEYMAFGLPIISSLDGELRTIIESYGIGAYYQAGDPHSLADAIRQLALDQPRREQAGRAARNLYDRQFNAERLTDSLIAHLESLVRGAH